MSGDSVAPLPAEPLRAGGDEPFRAEGDVHGGVGGLNFVPRPRPEPSRWEASTLTFGPVGRVLCTIFAFLPLILTITTGSFFWLMVTVATFILLPLWLRDTWRRV